MSIYGVNDALDVHAPHVQRCVEGSRVVICVLPYVRGLGALLHCSIAKDQKDGVGVLIL